MVYDNAIEELILLVEEHHNKKIDMVLYKSIEELFYRLRSTTTRMFYL